MSWNDGTFLVLYFNWDFSGGWKKTKKQITLGLPFLPTAQDESEVLNVINQVRLITSDIYTSGTLAVFLSSNEL